MDQHPQQTATDPLLPSASSAELRWRRAFRGEEGQLSQLRAWIRSLLPECSARDDVVSVANELGANAIRHTASGRGGWFITEITWFTQTVRVAVADYGAPAGPRLVSDPSADHGRGLIVIRGLAARTGVVGDTRGRLVWADIVWHDGPAPADVMLPDRHEAAIQEGEADLAHRFGNGQAWFGRSTLVWWALAGSTGLVSAPTARGLAIKLARVLETRHSAAPLARERDKFFATSMARNEPC
jgi:hypothetical protein